MIDKNSAIGFFPQIMVTVRVILMVRDDMLDHTLPFYRLWPSSKRGRIAEVIANNASKNFWRECKRISGSPKFVSNIIDGLTGDGLIAEIFSRKYREIYNSVPIDERDINDIECEMEDK